MFVSAVGTIYEACLLVQRVAGHWLNCVVFSPRSAYLESPSITRPLKTNPSSLALLKT